jgi:fatty acid desaturase
MKNFPATITDPVYIPKLKFNAFERLALKIINDKRDLPFFKLITIIHFLVIIPAILLFLDIWTTWAWWIVAIVYFYVSQFYFKGRFGLMLHCICHRKLFRKRFASLNSHIIWVLCPFFGHTPESYFSHHIGMHHMENNMPDDDSSTMDYQRDSITGFLKYYLDFLLMGFRDTVLYLYNRKRRKMYIHLTWGELSFYALCIGLCFVNLKATLLVFIVPFLFARMVMMLGNWTQHAFVDREDPANCYTNAIICINTKYNHVCWNDGYHVIHHLRPGMHYTELPTEFIKQKQQLADHKALVFEGIHYLHVFIYLMTKRYDKLERSLVNINQAFSSSEEAIALMKERTRRIPVSEPITPHIIPEKVVS